MIGTFCFKEACCNSQSYLSLSLGELGCHIGLDQCVNVIEELLLIC